MKTTQKVIRNMMIEEGKTEEERKKRIFRRKQVMPLGWISVAEMMKRKVQEKEE